MQIRKFLPLICGLISTPALCAEYDAFLHTKGGGMAYSVGKTDQKIVDISLNKLLEEKLSRFLEERIRKCIQAEHKTRYEIFPLYGTESSIGPYDDINNDHTPQENEILQKTKCGYVEFKEKIPKVVPDTVLLEDLVIAVGDQTFPVVENIPVTAIAHNGDEITLKNKLGIPYTTQKYVLPEIKEKEFGNVSTTVVFDRLRDIQLNVYPAPEEVYDVIKKETADPKQRYMLLNRFYEQNKDAYGASTRMFTLLANSAVDAGYSSLSTTFIKKMLRIEFHDNSNPVLDFGSSNVNFDSFTFPTMSNTSIFDSQTAQELVHYIQQDKENHFQFSLETTIIKEREELAKRDPLVTQLSYKDAERIRAYTTYFFTLQAHALLRTDPQEAEIAAGNAVRSAYEIFRYYQYFGQEILKNITENTSLKRGSDGHLQWHDSIQQAVVLNYLYLYGRNNEEEKDEYPRIEYASLNKILRGIAEEQRTPLPHLVEALITRKRGQSEGPLIKIHKGCDALERYLNTPYSFKFNEDPAFNEAFTKMIVADVIMLERECI